MIHCGEPNELNSLKFVKPEYIYVLRPHPILTTAAHSYDVNKMVIQLCMLSCRYHLGSLLRHFYPERSGICELCGDEL